MASKKPRGTFKNGTPFADRQDYCDGMTKPEYVAARKLSPLPRPVRNCRVCNHPERSRIEALKVAGASIDKLGEQFGIHRDAVWRHCTHHVSDATKASYLLGPAKIADLANAAADESRSIIDYLAIARSILVNQMDREAQANKPYAVERLAGRLVEVLRELGQCTGEVRKLAGTVINIQNNTQILNSEPFLVLQQGLLEVCAKHPEARADIIALFRELDERHAEPAAMVIEHSDRLNGEVHADV